MTDRTLALAPHAPAPTVSPAATPRQVVGALVAGAVVAGGVVILRLLGLLEGTPALVVGVLLALAVPTSRLLSRRILLTGAFFFGAVPALWWWSLPVGQLGRATVLLALASGALTTALWWHGPGALRARARAALPRLTPVDVIPVLAAGVTAWVALAWLRVGTGPRALSALLPGWDNSAHFAMVNVLRRHGVGVDQLGAAPGGEHWKFIEYPQGFHAAVATVMETLTSPSVADTEQEVVSYVQAQGWLLVAVAAMIAAGLCSLPRLRQRPVLAMILAAPAVAAFVVGPGGHAVAEGFGNFVVAAALTACVPLLVATMPRATLPLHLAAVGSLLVGVAHAWVLLLVVAAPAAVVLLVPFSGSRLRGTRAARAGSLVVVLLTLLGGLHAVGLLRVLDAGEVLVIPGAIVPPDVGLAVALALTAVGVCLWSVGRPGAARVNALALVPAVGLLAAAGLAVLQLRGGSELSYYFWKLLTGVLLVSIVMISLGVSRLVQTSRWSTRAPARVLVARTLAAVLLSVGATQVFGFTGLGRGVLTVPAADHPSTVALFRAAAATEAAPVQRLTLVVPPDDGELNPLNAQQWLLALTGRWTVESNDAAALLLGPGGASKEMITAVRDVMDHDPSTWVVISADQLTEMRGALEDLGLLDRVVAW